MKVYRPDSGKRKKVRAPKIKFLLYAIILAGVLYGAYYLVVKSDVFKVQQINVIGELKYFTSERLINEVEVAISEEGSSKVFTSESIFFWDKDFLFNHPFIKNFKLKKDIFERVVTIEIEERKRFGIWCFSGVAEQPKECYWFDSEGLALDRAPQTEGALIVQITDTESVFDGLGSRVAPENWFNVTMKILSVLESESIRFQSYVFNRQKQELIARTNRGTEVSFSLRFDPSAQIFKFLNQLIEAGQLDDLVYVDLTVENRIYTK